MVAGWPLEPITINFAGVISIINWLNYKAIRKYYWSDLLSWLQLSQLEEAVDYYIRLFCSLRR